MCNIGRWKLNKGSYSWTLRAEGNPADGLEYHEPKMDIYVVKADEAGSRQSLDINHNDAQMVINGSDGTTVNAGESIVSYQAGTRKLKQTLVLDSTSSTTTFNLEIETPGDYLIYTEHMPWEFAAMVLEDTAASGATATGTRFLWAVEARDYVLQDTQAGVYLPSVPYEPTNSGDSGRTPAPSTSNTTKDDGSDAAEVKRLEQELLAMHAAVAVAKSLKVTCPADMTKVADSKAGTGFVCTLPCMAGKVRRDCENEYCAANGVETSSGMTGKKKLVGLYVF